MVVSPHLELRWGTRVSSQFATEDPLVIVIGLNWASNYQMQVDIYQHGRCFYHSLKPIAVLFFSWLESWSLKNRNLELICLVIENFGNCFFFLVISPSAQYQVAWWGEHGYTPEHLPRLDAEGQTPHLEILCFQLNLALFTLSTLYVTSFWEV